MVDVYIDARSAQLLDRKQRGIGKYSAYLTRYISKLHKDYIHYYKLYIPFENFFQKYSPEIKTHLIARKLQMFYWLFDNKLLDYRVPPNSIFHSLDPIFIPKNRNYRRIVTVHDIIPIIFQKQYLHTLKPLIKNLYLQSINELPYVDQIITISQYTKKDIIKHLSIDENKIKVIYEAADPVFKIHSNSHCQNNIVNKLRILGDFILFVGGIDPRKNLETVIKALKNISLEYRNISLVIAGSDFKTEQDPIKKKIDKFIEKNNVGDKIISLGYVEDDILACLYNRAKMLIFPSFYEGFGLPIVEAMSCGCPVIASNRTSIPEIAGDAAILSDPEKIDEITNAALKILENTSLSNYLKHRGLKRSSNFSWEKTALQTVKVYNNYL